MDSPHISRYRAILFLAIVAGVAVGLLVYVGLRARTHAPEAPTHGYFTGRVMGVHTYTRTDGADGWEAHIRESGTDRTTTLIIHPSALDHVRSASWSGQEVVVYYQVNSGVRRVLMVALYADGRLSGMTSSLLYLGRDGLLVPEYPRKRYNPKETTPNPDLIGL